MPALQSGSHVGPYEILSLLGAGGMGEVYKARDGRLNRTVAIKTLAQQLSNDADVKKRFDREAQAVAALNHPHICVLYDVGCHNGVDYIVMEYLKGETRISHGGKPRTLFTSVPWIPRSGSCCSKGPPSRWPVMRPAT